jgi:hypothetical protein
MNEQEMELALDSFRAVGDSLDARRVFTVDGQALYRTEVHHMPRSHQQVLDCAWKQLL